ncbi:hypothetical protein [Azohydromonas lata]|uniref:hypothetical protein n=1 Tax=Azohydromonas lata TaxID=45677 RepID=UPI0012F5245B|nr:hypothetical protein [Azohydromonas lata]
MRATALFVQAVGTLTDTTRTLIEQDHEVHGVDDQAQQQSSCEDLLALAAA